MAGSAGSASASSAYQTGPAADVEYLSADLLFGDLEAADREWLEASVPAVTYGSGRVVHQTGQAGEILFWVCRGRLSAYWMGTPGRLPRQSEILPGTIFGEMVLAGQRLAPVRVVALEESEVRLLRRVDLERIIQRRPVVALRLLEILGQRLLYRPAGGSSASGADSSDLAARLADLLLGLADRHTGDLIGVMPHRLAALLEVDSAQVAQMLDEFCRAGYLILTPQRSRLRSPAALRRLAGR